MRHIGLFLLLTLLYTASRAQTTEVTGRVTDASTGEALPYVNVVFKGTTVGTSTDFDGFYTLKTTGKADSILVSYLGYISATRGVKPGIKQTINIQLKENTTDLIEVVIKPGENPAHRIIKAAQKNRDEINYERLSAFQYESFTKVQLAVDQLTEKQQNNKLLRSVIPLFDTVSQLTDGTTNPVLPVFISETISDFYVCRNPFRQKEVIRASRVVGVGMEDQEAASQLLGSTFQQYNFHTNYVRILEKDFVSPVGRTALDFYVFTLRDSMEIDGIKCYQIDVNPKRPADLVFTGTMWIADSVFAIRRLQFYMDKRANLNFLDQFKIQQEYAPTDSKAWVPSKTRILINLDEPSNVSPGMIALFYVSNRNIVVNQPKDPKFYEVPVEMLKDADKKDDEFWDENRHEQQTEGDKKIAKMIDTLNSLPVIRTWVEWVNIAISGYKRVGKVDFGPYAFLYGYNALEGHRFRVGFRTNHLLSESYILRGYVAYGTLDRRGKYSVSAEWYPDKKNWTVLGIKHRDDVDQIGVTDQNYDQSNLFTSLALFQASQLNRTNEQMLWAKRQWSPSWSNRITLHRKFYGFEPIRDRFNFAFFENPDPNANFISNDFRTTTITVETRFAYREHFVYNQNERYSLGPQKGPTLTFSYTRGLEGVLDGEFNYDKLNISVQQYIRMGRFGEGDYIVSAGKVFSALPYPILDVQRGNQSFVSNRATYNLMNLFEFVCDQYVALNYEHHFGGSVFNRIPLIKRLKWRFFATGKTVWGSISEQNLALLPKSDAIGRPVTQFYRLNREPYAEIGYGIENIFAFGRIDFIHRLTHLSNPGISPFGVKISLQFSF